MKEVLRLFATSTRHEGTQSQYAVFDKTAKLIQRSRTPKINPTLSRKTDYLRDDIALKTIERMAFISRGFDKTLEFGSGLGNFLRSLCVETKPDEDATKEELLHVDQLNQDKSMVRSKIKQFYMVEPSKELSERDSGTSELNAFEGEIIRISADEENFSSEDKYFESDTYDAVISNLSLHWINDLPKALSNINRILKPDGVFMGTLFGGDTLYELRTSLQLAELERRGGVSPRVSPLVRLDDVSSLLNRAGFSMLTIDAHDIVVGGFPDIISVCEDLQAMGEQNALTSRSNHLPRDVLLAANEIYKSLHGEQGTKGELILPVTFNVIFMIGWKKSPEQPQPLQRGTGEINLNDIL